MNKFLCTLLFFLVLGPHSAAAESLLDSELASDSSILLAVPSPDRLAIYNRPFGELSEREKWRVRIHGLRLAPLDPRVWGTLARERTENRTLVPIKRYFLRLSEDPTFTLASLTVRFHFQAVNPRYMTKMPHQKDPVFEIGIGGEIAQTSIDQPLLKDRIQILRLSAFPRLASGFFRREFEQYSEISAGTPQHLAVKERYELQLNVERNRASAYLNGVLFAELAASGLASGLVTLQTSWHPVFIEELVVSGSLTVDGAKQEIAVSGLINTASDGK